MNEKGVIEILKNLGYAAKKIEESNERSADFLIQFENVTMIGELKTKSDAAEFLHSEKRLLEMGMVHLHLDSTARNNTLSGLVGDAVEQIKNMMTKYNSEFGVFICEMLEPYSGDKVRKMVNTLYGRKFAIPVNTNEESGKWCYYCTYSDFFRYRDVLNAAFIISGSTCEICINNVALNYLEFLNSGLLDPLKGRFNDPHKEIERGEAFEIEGDIDRTNDSAIQEYFRGKFGFEAVALMDFPSVTASSRLA